MRDLPKIEWRSGSCRVRIRVDGERFTKTFGTPAEAHAWAAAMRQGQGQASEKCLLDGVELVLAEAEAARVATATMGYYRQQTNVILDAIGGHRLIDEITTEDLREFIAARNATVGAGTVAKNLAMLRRVFRRSLGEGWIRDDPTAKLAPLQSQIGKRHRPKRYAALSAAQLDSILAQIRGSGFPAAQRHADVMEVMWSTAVRRREFSDVRVKHVDVWTGRIEVDPKTQGDVVYVDGPAKDALGRLAKGREPEDRLFGTKAAISSMFKRWKKRLGTPDLRAHSLRHGAATHLVRRGVQLLDLQSFMRHATPVMTARYYHADEERQRRTGAELHRRGDPRDDGQPQMRRVDE